MASGLTGNEVPGNRLWVRVPCPPLVFSGKPNFSDALVPGEVGLPFAVGGGPKRFVCLEGR